MDKKKMEELTGTNDKKNAGGNDRTPCNEQRYRGNNINSIDDFILRLHEPVESSCIGIVRALFGLMMILDVVHERGLHSVEEKYGNPMNCHFPLFHWWMPLQFEYMGFIFLVMWFGAFGICLGLFFKLSCILFIVPYWYIYLLDKSSWNNHSYLYGLVSILFFFSSAHYSFSLDSLYNSNIKNQPIPAWNYWIIRFQFFLLYFYAGLKKTDPDWIGGHSMVTLSTHWVFDPFRLVLTNEQIDMWIVHVFGFVFDLTVGFFLLVERTRPVAILFSTSFHLMNSRMFQIGQFAYVCLVTTPIFCRYSWPKHLCLFDTKKEEKQGIKPKTAEMQRKKASWRQKATSTFLACYVALQLFLPYSHGFTEGYNNWTSGLYGYSWDMMVHSWDTTSITITVIDHHTGQFHYLHPESWVRNTRYSKHADMMVQYAACIKRNLNNIADQRGVNELQNISIYMDVWCSLNNRFQQRVFHPHQDLLSAPWTPFTKTPWVLPLLTDLTPWRGFIAQKREEVLGWSNKSDCMFFADSPGFAFTHFIRKELANVTLHLLRGAVTVDNRNSTTMLVSGESINIASGMFHNVETISNESSCFVYTYVNNSHISRPLKSEVISIFSGLDLRWDHFKRSISTINKCLQIIAVNMGLL